MPTLKIEKTRFNELMGQDWQFQKLEQLGFEFGIEVEQQKRFDNDLKKDIESYKFDCMNNRPDLLTENTLARALKIYLGKVETPEMTLTKFQEQIKVDPSVKQIRPFVVGAILRNIKFTETTYNQFINAQEKLHATFCRNRKYASMGTHDYDKVKGPFRYVAMAPDSFKFAPLNQTEEVDGHGLMKLYESHKLKEYLPLIRDSPVYPVILDARDKVCSVPPIINSDYSKISIHTKNVFIEITALTKPKAMIALNTLVWSFSEYCQNPFEIEPIEIVMEEEDKTFETPDISKQKFLVSHTKAEQLVGAPLTHEEVVKYLKRTGMETEVISAKSYEVTVPSWRSDVLHECDILEDIAIGYGYTKIKPTLPPTSTIGSQLRINKFIDFLRHEMAQAQYNEVLNFALCSKADLTTNIFNQDQSKLITISNAKTRQFQTGRTSLLPGLLRTIIENKAMAMPYRIFESGDCIIKDGSGQTGARNVRRLAAAITDQVIDTEGAQKKDIFSMIHGAMDLILKKSGMQFKKDYQLRLSQSNFYFPGQQFEVMAGDQVLGSLGVVHPRVIKKFGWNHPTVMWEIDVVLLEKKFFKN